METVDINNVKIFSKGKWAGKGSPPGGTDVTEEYLNKIVKTYNEIGEKIKPRMRLSHDDKNSKSATGMASLGWLKNLRVKGGELIADLKAVPKKIKDLIDQNAFGRFSPGIYPKLNVNGKIYENVIEHLALLGAQLPANMDLDGLIDLYENTEIEYEIDSEIVTFEEKIIKEDISMSEKDNILEAQITEYENKFKTVEKDLSDKDAEIQALKKEKQQLLSEKRADFENKADNYFDEKIKEGKLTPAQKRNCMALVDDSEIKTFSFIENDEQKEIEGTTFDLLKNIIEDNNVKFEFDGSEKSNHVEIQKPKGEEMQSEIYDDDKLDDLIQAKIKQDNIDYSAAYEAVILELAEKEEK